MADELEALRADVQRIEKERSRLTPLREHWIGAPPTAYLSPDAQKKLQDRMRSLSVNWPRHIVSAYVDRMTLAGFTLDGAAADDVWGTFRAAGLEAGAELVHTDRLLYGASFLTIIPDAAGVAAVPDSPRTMTADVDPLTGQCRRAVRYWTHRGKGHALVLEADHVTRWETDTPETGAAGQWRRRGETVPGPYALEGLHPTVPFIRRTSGDDYTGTSLVADVLDLTDAGNKLMGDAMVTSEDYARPRRWATGLEIEEDADGNLVDPFERGRGLQSEDPGTKFGQFAPASLEAYSNMIGTVRELIGALSGLPPHYLGLAGDQPPTAEAVRATESQLTSRVYSELRSLSGPWADVAARLDLAASERAEPRRFVTAWESPEIRTPGMAADAAQKLHSIGVPLEHLLSDPLGFTPDEAAQITRASADEMVARAAAEMAARQGRR